MTTKPVTRETKEARTLASKIKEFAAGAGADLKAFAAELGYTPTTDLTAAFADVAKILELAADRAEASDQSHGSHALGHAAPANVRDAEVEATRKLVVDDHVVLSVRFGAAQVAPAFPQPIPRTSSALSTYVGQVVKQLDALGPKWTVASTTVVVDLAATAAALTAAKGRLDAAIKGVSDHDAATSTTHTDRDRDASRLHRALIGGHGLVAGALTLLGHEVQASRLVLHHHSAPAATVAPVEPPKS